MTSTAVKLALRWPRKLTFELMNILLLRPVENVSLLYASVLLNHRKKRRLRYTAVKNEQMRPTMSVVAKPLMGPVPKSSKITPVIIEVRFESKIAEKALL